MKQTINVTINGRRYQEDAEPRQLLSYFLREVIGLTGTHIGCVIGECGACTILLDGKLVKNFRVRLLRLNNLPRKSRYRSQTPLTNSLSITTRRRSSRTKFSPRSACRRP